jgi:hypothetical protein
VAQPQSRDLGRRSYNREIGRSGPSVTGPLGHWETETLVDGFVDKGQVKSVNSRLWLFCGFGCSLTLSVLQSNTHGSIRSPLSACCMSAQNIAVLMDGVELDIDESWSQRLLASGYEEPAATTVDIRRSLNPKLL